ncbi:MAG: beta-mannosidase [Armatimonadota bacterium]
MSGTISLNGTWGLTWAEGSHLMVPHHYWGTELRGRTLLPAAVPGPIHQVLMDAGLLEDPNLGMNSLKARWVEEMFWIYRHTFTAPAEAAEQTAWLVFDKLEYDAVILLNGEEVGRHANAHRPARINVTGKVRAGENLIVVQTATGLHSSADKPGEGYFSGEIGKLTKRHWCRTAQYQYGWDWNARLINVGILGDVRLEWSAVPRLDQVTVFAVPTADLAKATMHVRATIDGVNDVPVEAVLTARIVETGQEVTLPVTVAAGENRQELTIAVNNPHLWWPIGHGEQFRYTVEVTLTANGEHQSATRKTGIRRVEIDQTPHPVEGCYCMLKINNRPIFCKGGNWVPADMLYSTVTPERYRQLVDLAIEANFNLLRIWGGAIFADHALLEACDEVGVLIWHDFLFACAKYPGMDPAFAAEVRREVTFAVRELAHHPSLAVWCGNNEIEWGDWGWGYDTEGPTHPHYAIFHHDIPLIVKTEDSSTVHWMSSPYSPDLSHPNNPIIGDQHPWTVSMEGGGADFWKYRANVDRFPNEGGILGASSPATLRQFLPEYERDLFSPSWEHHDNPFAALDSQQGALGHAYQTVEMWTGHNPLTMEMDDYAFVSALLQAEGLYEYISNYRRRMFSSASAIFWMYNDSWPVTHGWTIVDYYLRKKLAYHPVRRAFQPVTVVVAEEDGVVTVYGVNDTPQAWTGEVRYGLFNLTGDLPKDAQLAVTLAANASTPLAQFTKAEWEALELDKTGAFAVLLQDGTITAQHRLFLAPFKALAFAEPAISMNVEYGTLTLNSDTFAWGVCLDVDGELPLADNCIDLLPGIPYTMPWDVKLGEPQVVRVGNRDAVKPAMQV